MVGQRETVKEEGVGGGGGKGESERETKLSSESEVTQWLGRERQ